MRGQDKDRYLDAGFVFALIFAAAFKNDSGSFLTLQNWRVPLPFFVSILKDWSPVALVVAGMLLALKLVRRRFSIRRNQIGLLFLLLSFLALIRVTFIDLSLAAKLGAGLFIAATIIIYMSVARISDQPSRSSAFSVGASWCAVVLVVVNSFVVLMGYGFAEGVPRLFGTTAQPNFLGVQLALATILLLSRAATSTGAGRLIFSALILVSLYLQILTGSRTSFVVCLTGVATFLAFSGLFSRKVALSAFVGASIVVLYVLYSNARLQAGFDRGSTGFDTRTEAWSELWNIFVANPWLGSGPTRAASENSYLRALATYGLVYTIVFIGSLGLLFRCWYFEVKKVGTPRSALVLSLVSALMLGGVFEGYLTDTFSVPVVILLFAVGMAPPLKMKRLAA